MVQSVNVLYVFRIYKIFLIKNSSIKTTQTFLFEKSNIYFNNHITTKPGTYEYHNTFIVIFIDKRTK